jgi:hypothetical protein
MIAAAPVPHCPTHVFTLVVQTHCTRSTSFFYQASTGQVNNGTFGAHHRVADLNEELHLVLHVDGAALTFSVRTREGRLQPQPGLWTLPSTFVVFVAFGAAPSVDAARPRCALRVSCPP